MRAGGRNRASGRTAAARVRSRFFTGRRSVRSVTRRRPSGGEGFDRVISQNAAAIPESASPSPADAPYFKTSIVVIIIIIALIIVVPPMEQSVEGGGFGVAIFDARNTWDRPKGDLTRIFVVVVIVAVTRLPSAVVDAVVTVLRSWLTTGGRRSRSGMTFWWLL